MADPVSPDAWRSPPMPGAGKLKRRYLVVFIATGTLVQLVIAYLVFSLGVRPLLAGDSPLVARPSNASTTEDARIVAQTFLRQLAAKKFDLACTQAILPGLVNPCMEDLQARDLQEVYKAGDRIVVVRTESRSTLVTVSGKDTRPIIGEDFLLTLKFTGEIWLVQSINGKRIVDSP